MNTLRKLFTTVVQTVWQPAALEAASWEAFIAHVSPSVLGVHAILGSIAYGTKVENWSEDHRNRVRAMQIRAKKALDHIPDMTTFYEWTNTAERIRKFSFLMESLQHEAETLQRESRLLNNIRHGIVDDEPPK